MRPACNKSAARRFTTPGSHDNSLSWCRRHKRLLLDPAIFTPYAPGHKSSVSRCDQAELALTSVQASGGDPKREFLELLRNTDNTMSLPPSGPVRPQGPTQWPRQNS